MPDRSLSFTVIAFEKAKRALDRVGNAFDQVRRKADRLDGKRATAHAEVRGARDAEQKLDRLNRALERFQRRSIRTDRSVRLTQRGLVTLIAATAALVPELAAMTAAFGAFGLVAAPTIAKVVSSTQDLGANWDSLNAQQRQSARVLDGLIGRYKALNRQFEPQALQAFNNALVTGNTLMRQMKPLVATGGAALVAFTARLNAEFANPAWTEFFTFLADEAPAAVRNVGDTMFNLLGAVRDLTEALAPLSGIVVETVGGIAKLVGAVSDANPLLVQLLTVTLLLRGPFIAAQNAATRFGQRLLELDTNAKRAGAALRLLGKTAVLLGITLLVNALSKASEASKEFADSVTVGVTDSEAKLKLLRAELERQNAIIDKSAGKQRGFGNRYAELGDQVNTARLRSKGLREEIADLEAQRRAEAEAARLEADVTGTVNAALRTAADTTRTMETRLKALKVALDAVFNPSIDVWNATTQLKRGYDELVKSLKKAHGNFKGNTKASQDLRDAFAQQLKSVVELFDATQRKTGSDVKARKAVQRQLPVLRALAGRNKGAQRQVDALAQSLGIATGKSNTNRRSFIRSARQMGITKNAATRLWREYNKIPRKKKTNVTNNARGKPSRDLDTYLRKIAGIPSHKTTTLTVIEKSRTPGGHPHLTRRQHGGPVHPGETFLVGERGPELLTVGRSGFVTPNQQTEQILAGAGRPTVVQNIKAEVHDAVDVDTLAARLRFGMKAASF